MISLSLLPVRVSRLGARRPDRVKLLAAAVGMPLLQHHLARRGRAIQVRVAIDESVFPVAIRTVSDLHVLNEVLVARIYDVPALRSAQLIVDAGGNIGVSTLYFKARRPEARVLTVEPDPRAFRQLERNAGKLPGVSLHRCALALEQTKATLYSSPQTWRSSLLPQRDAEPVAVRTTSLGDLLGRYAIDRVDLLKLDIEGGEFAVLRDIAGLQRVEALIAELHFDLSPGMTLEEARRHLTGFEVMITGGDSDRPTLYAVKER